jgi:hypothetical protein
MIHVILNTSEIDATLSRLMSISFDPFFKDSGQYIENQTTKRLSKGVDVAGDPFVPLKKKYTKRKEKAGYGSKPVMTATGDLGRALFSQMLADDESLTTVIGMHRAIPGLNASIEAMASIAERLERGDAPLAGPREILGLDDPDAEWVFDRFAIMFEPELT